MGVFGKVRAHAGRRAPTPESARRLDLSRFGSLLERSVALREAGVTYEAIERRAAAEDVSFNEALEAIYAERVAGSREGLRADGGASAVEFALLAPLLFMLVFAIIGFGLGFLKVQSIRTAVREGGRAAAVGAPVNTIGSMKGTRETTVGASSGAIPTSRTNTIQVSSSQGGRCTSGNIGQDVTVTYPVPTTGEGSIVVKIPFLPDITLKPTITASFRCEI